MNRRKLLPSLITVSLILAGLALAFHWTVNRIYVPEGQSLQLRYKGSLVFGDPVKAKPGHFAKEGEVGVLAQLRGPGRHFYCPIWWQRKVVHDVVVKPGEVAIVTSKLGGELTGGDFLVDGDIGETKHKGVLRKVYGPGRYRANPYGYEFSTVQTRRDEDGNQVKHSGWVEVPAGYVGVVTYLTNNPAEDIAAGIQENVLPPGIYPVNPRERHIDIVEIGFREVSLIAEKKTDGTGKIAYDESGEPLPVPETGINFPSNDGFKIQMDFTAVWGVMPDQAPQIVRTFGNIEAVEQKVILPQSESICRNNGSKMGAVELLVGDTRQEFQLQTSKDFQEVLKDKNVTLLYGLVRHIYIPQEVRVPIQNGYIADELTLTRVQERDTAKTEAKLREEEKKVDLEAEKILVETDKMVALVLAEGEKKSKEIDAETQQLVAAIDRQAAELDAQKVVVLGEADATADKMRQEASAEKFGLAVKAFGSGSAYTKWEFAKGLPDDIDLKLLYAGEGTLWTDLKSIVPTIPLRDAKSKKSSKP